ILLEDLKQVSCIHLISTTGNEELYRKLGFKKLKTGMAIYKSKKLDREYTE
ncbi:GNAT family N-acetyltransferase, partial [Mammaliicoccus sciuri]|nr:GNAT family N-acetyltransferase [Mammaliicoccus sciuri]